MLDLTGAELVHAFRWFILVTFRGHVPQLEIYVSLIATCDQKPWVVLA